LKNSNKELAIINFEKAIYLATTLKDENLERYKSQLEAAKSSKK
jgi:hypothetical protein